MGQRVQVSLVMPVRNEEAMVEATLDAVFASTRLPDEIVISDGMSTDRTLEKVRAYGDRGVPMRVVANPTLYSGGGRNIGIRNASFDVILLADFGNKVDQHWIEEMIRPFEERDDVDIVAGLHRPWVTSDFEHCLAAIHYHHEYMLARYSPEQRLALVPKAIVPGGASLGLTRRIWERVGGYPEWLPRAQDRLFSRKAWCMGARVAVSWNAWTAHHMRRGPAEVFLQLFSYGRGNGRSRCIDRHVFRLLGVYGVVAALAVATTWSWMLGATAGALLIAYAYRAGLRKILKVDGGLNQLRYLWMAPCVVFSRDLGVLLGHLAGWLEFGCSTRYRRLFTAYTKDSHGMRVVWG
jgi:glycosyltransferase involved in cell wall biosynthesis